MSRQHSLFTAVLAPWLILALLVGCGTRSSTVTVPGFGDLTGGPSAPPASLPPVKDNPLPLFSATPASSAPSTPPSPRAPHFLPTPSAGVGRRDPAVSPAPSAVPSPGVIPSTSPSPAGPNAYDIVNAAFQLFNSTSTYQATLDTFEVGPTKTLRATVNAAFRKPNAFRLEVVSSNDSQSQGGIMVYTGGSTVQVKVGSGIFAGTVLTLSLTDPRLLSPRGDRLDQSDVQSILRQFTEPGAQVAYAGASAINGRPAHILELRTSSMRSRSVSKAHIGFDAEGKYLVLREEYDLANRLTLRVTIRNVQLNPQLAASLFTLS